MAGVGTLGAMKTQTTSHTPRPALGERIRQRLLLWERLWANARPGAVD